MLSFLVITITLFQNQRAWGLESLLRGLDLYWNRSFNYYPIVIFHEDLTEEEQATAAEWSTWNIQFAQILPTTDSHGLNLSSFTLSPSSDQLFRSSAGSLLK